MTTDGIVLEALELLIVIMEFTFIEFCADRTCARVAPGQPA